MAFNAGKIIEPLEWDFTDATVVPDATSDDKGVIPEPSSTAVDLFGARYRGLLQQLYDTLTQDDTAVPGETTEQAAHRILEQAQKPLLQRLDEWSERTSLPNEDAVRINDEMIRIVADVCGGSPTEAQIRKLPSRILRLFIGWLNEELTSPKLKDGALSSTKS